MSLTSTQRTDTNVVELEIAVGGEELRAASDKVYRRQVKTITVPGFRKGKAPRSIIEKMYGDGIFLEDAVNDLYPGAYEAAVEEAGITPVDKANVEILSLDKESGFTFKATVTVKPEVNVKSYKGIEAEKETPVTTAEDVDAELTHMRERGARLVTVEDVPAKSGDNVSIDYEGFLDGVPFEGGKDEAHTLNLGSGQFIPGFEDQVIGHKAGEEFEVNVTFPEEYHSQELSGKPAVFKVKINEVQAKELPELDDEFAKDVSEFDTLEELRRDIEAKIQEQKEKKAQDDFESQLVDAVVAELEGDIPQCMYDNKIDELMRDFEYRLQSQGMRLDLYLQYTGMDMETFRAGYSEQAQRQVKIRLALEKIADLENIEVTDEDVNSHYETLVESYGEKLTVEQARAFIPEREVRADIRCTKAIDIIRDNAKVTEKKAPAKAAKTTKKKAAESGDEKAEKPKAAKKTTAAKPRATKKKAEEKPGDEAEAPQAEQ